MTTTEEAEAALTRSATWLRANAGEERYDLLLRRPRDVVCVDGRLLGGASSGVHTLAAALTSPTAPPTRSRSMFPSPPATPSVAGHAPPPGPAARRPPAVSRRPVDVRGGGRKQVPSASWQKPSAQ